MGNLYVVRCWIHLKNSRADHQRDRCEITTKFSTVSSRSVRPLENDKTLLPFYSCLIFFLWVLCKLFFPIFCVLFYYLKFCGNSLKVMLKNGKSNYEQYKMKLTKKSAWTMSLTEKISNIFEHFQLKYLLPWSHTSSNDWYVRWPALTHFQQENEKWIMPLHLLL